MPSVSHSEADSYLLCRRKHYYGYGLSLQRITTSSSLAMGSAVHKILEAFYKEVLAAGDEHALQLAAFDSGVSKAQEQYDAIIADGFEQDEKRAPLWDVLFKWYFPNEHFIKKGWRILAVEMEFNLEYDSENHLTYPFIVDAIFRDPEGKIVVVDHKAVWDFYTYADSELQPQIPKYIAGLRALNYKIDYGMYNMLRTRRINGAKMNKAELVEALTNHFGQDAAPGEIEGLALSKMKVVELEELAAVQKIQTSTGASLDQMLETLMLTPTITRVQRTFLDQIETASKVQALKSLPIEEQDRLAVRVANKMVCQSCSFKDVCTTELREGNAKLMIATEYTIRERKVWDESISEDAA